MTTPQAETGTAHREDEGRFLSRDGLELYWRSLVPTAPRAHVVFLHGYSDHSGRYPDLFDFLLGSGFAVHTFDYRGHGRAAGRRGHVDRFDDYLQDLEAMLARVRPSLADGERLFIVAHSHGALVVARWLLERPEGVAGVVMSSPFFRLGFTPPALKVMVAKAIGKVIPFLPVGNELEEEKLTHDEAIQERTRQDKLYNHTTTPRWFTEAQATQEEVMRRASEIVVPLLVLQAEADTIVDPQAAREWYEAVTSSDKTYEGFDGFFHEVFNEVERQRAFDVLGAWLDARLSR